MTWPRATRLTTGVNSFGNGQRRQRLCFSNGRDTMRPCTGRWPVRLIHAIELELIVGGVKPGKKDYWVGHRVNVARLERILDPSMSYKAHGCSRSQVSRSRVGKICLNALDTVSIEYSGAHKCASPSDKSGLRTLDVNGRQCELILITSTQLCRSCQSSLKPPLPPLRAHYAPITLPIAA